MRWWWRQMTRGLLCEQPMEVGMWELLVYTAQYYVDDNSTFDPIPFEN
jgi:hypothetical protein